jgi:hypothetical protein
MDGCTGCWGGGERRVRGEAIWAQPWVKGGGGGCHRWRAVPAAEVQGDGLVWKTLVLSAVFAFDGGGPAAGLRGAVGRSSSPSVSGFASVVPGWSTPLGSDLNKGGSLRILLTPS